MDSGTVRRDGTHGPVVSRRRLLQSGVGVAAAGVLTRGGVDVASAQTSDNWPIQGFDPENTRYTAETTPLEEDPGTVARAEVAAGPPDDYLLTAGVAYLHGEGNGVGAIDVETGDLQWQFDPGETAVIPEGIDGDDLLARAVEGTVYTIDTDTGETTSEVALGYGFGLGYDGTGRWFAPLADGEVVAGDVGSSDTAWETEIEGVGFRPAVTDDRVFVSAADTPASEIDRWSPESLDAEGRLYALNAADGSVVWETSRVGVGSGTPAVRNGRVHWAGADGDVLTYDAETGDAPWEFKGNESLLHSPAVTENAVLAGSQEGTLYVIDAESGEEIRQFSVGSAVSTSPVVAGDVAYVGTEDGTVTAFDYGGDGLLWEFDVGWAVRSLAPGNGRVVAGTGDGYDVIGSVEPTETAGDGVNTAGSDGGGTSGSTGESDGGSDGDGRAVRERGLFSNDGDEPDAVSNPFNLTTLGFLLSVAGIGYQMLEGR